MKRTVYIKIAVNIVTDLHVQEAMNELGAYTDYSISGTDNVEVKSTEILEVSESEDFN